jgi:hypothetical protein
MSDKPILFSAPMVRAILDGRKTQTRRVLKPQPSLFEIDDKGTPCQVGVLQVQGRAYNQLTLGSDEAGVIPSEPRLHSVGDTLWVKETWRTEARYHALAPRSLPKNAIISFDADYDCTPNDGCRGRVRQSIFMMRHMSRLHLLVTGVKVERLQDISEADAMAEGWNGPLTEIGYPTAKPVQWFSSLWDSINGPGSWDANPWVVAYTFERIKSELGAV